MTAICTCETWPSTCALQKRNPSESPQNNHVLSLVHLLSIFQIWYKDLKIDPITNTPGLRMRYRVDILSAEVIMIRNVRQQGKQRFLDRFSAIQYHDVPSKLGRNARCGANRFLEPFRLPRTNPSHVIHPRTAPHSLQQFFHYTSFRVRCFVLRSNLRTYFHWVVHQQSSVRDPVQKLLSSEVDSPCFEKLETERS